MPPVRGATAVSRELTALRAPWLWGEPVVEGLGLGDASCLSPERMLQGAVRISKKTELLRIQAHAYVNERVVFCL